MPDYQLQDAGPVAVDRGGRRYSAIEEALAAATRCGLVLCPLPRGAAAESKAIQIVTP